MRRPTETNSEPACEAQRDRPPRSGRRPRRERPRRSSGVVAGIRDAGPIAIAGLVANSANVVVTVVVARLLTSRGYGELAQLNGVFLFLSMPGSALARRGRAEGDGAPHGGTRSETSVASRCACTG